jgi:formylglycine-generating enzyme required for sulfatase activity
MRAAWLVLVVAGACSPSPASKDPSATLALAAEGRCDSLETELGLIGWNAAQNAQLSRIADQSLVVVGLERRGPCQVDLSVLPNCVVRKASYRYTAYSETRTVLAHDEASLAASFPLGAQDLGARIAQGMGVRADYRLAGVQRIPIGTAVDRADLSGSCDGATHIVTAIHRGAFVLASGAKTEIRTEGSELLSGRPERIDVLESAGRADACVASPQPVQDCDVPLRLEFAEIVGQGLGEVTLPPARTDRPWARPGPALEYPPGSRCPTGMVEIAGGEFTMGDNAGPPIQQPEHKVEVQTFCLDKTEVTAGAYQKCMEASVCPAWEVSYGKLYPPCNDVSKGQENYPRNCVSYDAATDYCGWLGKRLPTEQEWEYAAKGGARNFKYPWGNMPPDRTRACYGKNRFKDSSCPVASFPLEASGVYDLGGNLNEYVTDRFVRYPGSSFHSGSGERMCRGGDFWDKDPKDLESAARSLINCGRPTGFRCAL